MTALAVLPPIPRVGEQPAAELGESGRLGVLELIQDGCAFGYRQGNARTTASDGVRDDGGAAEGLGLSVSEERRQRAAGNRPR